MMSPRGRSESRARSRRTSRVTRTRGGGLAMTTSLETGTDATLPSTIPAGYEKRLMVTAGRASRELGGRIAERLGVGLTDAGLKTFADGEVYCRYADSIRGADLFVVQSICGS